MKRTFSVGFIVLLVAGALAAGSAQVFPVRWQDEDAELAPAVAPGAVAIGAGGVSLNPDTTFATTTAGFAPGGLVIPDNGCSAANRGEIRLKELTGLDAGPVLTVDVDALCLCTRKVVRSSLGDPIETFSWSCFNTSVN